MHENQFRNFAKRAKRIPFNPQDKDIQDEDHLVRILGIAHRRCNTAIRIF